MRIKLLLHRRHCVFGAAAAIPVLVNIIALHLARDAISVESLVISLVRVKEEQESKQATGNSQISKIVRAQIDSASTCNAIPSN